MHVIAIDAGTYSVKFISTRIEKKKSYLKEIREYILREEMDRNPQWESPQEAVDKIIRSIIKDHARPDSRIMLHVPPDMVTTRFLRLPVKNRKKAEQMIPFQLEEDIPFSISESHYSWIIEVEKNESVALVALTKENDFSNFYQKLLEWDHSPSYVSTEPSILNSYFALNPQMGAYCVIDLGHKTTKAYFFLNSKLISTHVSYVGGRLINEIISKTYNITIQEAIQYKHQNAFVLTSGQLEEVDKNQKDFALMMEQIFSPLINEFRRWQLGFRVTTEIKIAQVYLCGGSSQVKNINNFLTEKLQIKCSTLDTFQDCDTSKVEFSNKKRARFAIANMMGLSLKSSTRLINLLSGAFSQGMKGDFPLHTFSFLASRSLVIALILIMTQIGHRVFLELDIKAVNAKLTTIAKNPALAMNAREKRILTTQPAVLAQNFLKKSTQIKQQINVIQSSANIQALSPLVAVSSMTSGLDVMMTRFSVSESSEVSALFKSDSNEALENLKARLKTLNLKDINLVTNEDKTLSLTGYDQ
jgi:general secretion pathway protein L